MVNLFHSTHFNALWMDEFLMNLQTTDMFSLRTFVPHGVVSYNIYT